MPTSSPTSSTTAQSQFALFKKRQFSALFFTQFLGAFNDNVFKQALILLITYRIAAELGQSISLLTNLAAMLFILPYFLFSATAGQIADTFDKARLTRLIKLCEIGIMAMAFVGFMADLYYWLFVALFLMGMHSTFFGPIKYAYLPENMAPNELLPATGLFQMGTSLAILFGMGTAGLLQSFPIVTTAIFVLIVAILGYIAARFIPQKPRLACDTLPHTKRLQTDRQKLATINWNIVSASHKIIQYAYQQRFIFFILLGNSWFWFYGATFLTQLPEYTKTVLRGAPMVVVFMLTLFSVGTAIGSALCKTLAKNQANLKLLPLGIIGLSLFALDLALNKTADLSLQAANLSGDDYYTIGQLLPNAWRIFLDVFLIGTLGGIYIVPLYALMQKHAPKGFEARIVGANNIFNALFMVISALFAMIALKHFSISQLFLITSIINAAFGLFLYQKLNMHQPF